jgi:hypothetical protein
VAAIFRLDTSFGGGKTHGLIALVHAARGMPGVDDPSEFIDPTLIPQETVRVAAFDGENADPANGRRMGDGVMAYTPWGEIAYALAGEKGYERVRRSADPGTNPHARHCPPSLSPPAEAVGDGQLNRGLENSIFEIDPLRNVGDTHRYPVSPFVIQYKHWLISRQFTYAPPHCMADLCNRL